MQVFVLQPTDRGFQFIKYDPKVYASLQAAFAACKRALQQDLDFHMRKRGGMPYTEQDVCLYVNEKKFSLNVPLDPVTIREVLEKGSGVKIVAHYCNDVQCYLLTVCGVVSY
jgi:hypothetical protein